MRTHPFALARPASALVCLALVVLQVPVAGCKPKDAADTDTDTDTDSDADADSDTDSGANLPPSAPGVSLDPAAPSGAVDLVAHIDTPAEDPESQRITYAYAWSVDGADRPDLTTDTVAAGELTEGAAWAVAVTPNDGAQDGPAGTASATVHNDPPMVLGHLEPLVPVPNDTITLVWDVAPADPNGDAVTTTIKWYKNGSYHVDWDGLLALDPLQARGGDDFVAEYWTTDGVATTELQQAEVRVTDTPPEITSLTLSPTSPKNGDDLKAKVRATDADGNTLTYSYAWYRNGVEATDVGDTDTVPAADTEIDDVWYYIATVSDGTEAVTDTSDSVTIIPWEGTHEIYTFNATIPTGAATSSGTWAIQYLTHGESEGENDCDLSWTFTGVEDKPLCRGCEFRFDTVLTYDASASTVTKGCDTAQVDGTGEWTFNATSNNFYALMTGPAFTYSMFYPYTADPVRMSFAGSGGTGYSDTANARYQYYSLTSTEDSAGNTQFTAYLNYGSLAY